MKFRDLTNRIRAHSKAQIMRFPGPIRSGYLRLFSEAIGRETRAVGAGIDAYNHGKEAPLHAYELRRNIHMLEKGITMKPRRNEFGLAYIEDTVLAYNRICCDPTSTLLGTSEAHWMQSVLAEYFDVTSTSENPLIRKLRIDFESYQTSLELISGPHISGDRVSPVEFEDLRRLAEDRRSVRWFLDTVVDRAIVDRAFSLAAEAPTACNRQPYRFEVFDEPDSIAKVGAIPMGTRGYLHQIPGLIVVVGDLSAFFDERDRHLIYVDSCLAAMSFIFGLEAQGVSSCCINWPDIPDKDEAMAQILGLKSHERVVMLIAYGYADPLGLVPFSAKKSFESVREFRTL